MSGEPPIAFPVTSPEPPALEVRVNFGIVAGREATPAEIDELGKALRPDVPQVSIVSEQRYELSAEVEASLHQVRIEVPPDRLPRDPAELDALAARLAAVAETWARDCFEDRHAEISEP